MSQTKAQSVIESIVNVLVGYVVAITCQVVLFKVMGIPSTMNQNIQIALWFTAVSLIRSYCIRRMFNQWQ